MGTADSASRALKSRPNLAWSRWRVPLSMLPALVPVLLLLVVLAEVVPSLSVSVIYPFRDSGVFLYVGQRILDGQVPYRDVWDHKPPLIFYVNALGLWLGFGSPWGVWILETLGLWLSAWLSFLTLRHLVDPFAAVLGTLAWLIALRLVYQGGNFTELVALPLLFASLWLLASASESASLGRRASLIGACGGAVVLCQQNLIGLYLALSICLLLRDQRHAVRHDLALLWGTMLAVVAAVVAYFAAVGALADAWSAVVTFNRVYSSVAIHVRAHALLYGMALYAQTGLVALLLLGLLATLARLHVTRAPGQRLLLLVVGIDALLEPIMSALPGRTYPHYYVVWLPMIAVLSALAVAYLRDWTGQPRLAVGAVAFAVAIDLLFCVLAWRWHVHQSKVLALPVLSLLVVLLAARWKRLAKWTSWNRWALVAGMGALSVAGSFSSWNRGPIAQTAAARYVRTHTASNDYILLWGAETSMYVVTGRRAPGRFVYQYPLVTSGYQTTGMVSEFLEDLRRHPPDLVIDASSSAIATPSLDAAKRDSSPLLSMLQPVFAYIVVHYRVVTTVGGWPVYERTR